MPKHKHLIILFALALLLPASFVYGLEAKYPWIPMVGTITEESELGDYVGYFFGLGMYIAGILAVISFTIGAIQTIMAGSSPEMEKDGKDRMRGAILGLVLTLSAFVILQTINPKFVTPTLTPLPGVAGIFYAKEKDLKAAPMAEADISASETIKNGFDKIKYCCNPPNESGDCPGGDAPTLLVWKFPNKNFKGTGDNFEGVEMGRVGCGGETDIGGSGSFKMDYEKPGIYYFLGEDCAGYMSDVNTTTQDKISEPFTAKIKSVKIVNDPGNYKYYGAIFHNKPTASDASDCTNPILVYGDGKTCYNLPDTSFPGFAAYSVEIFRQGKDLTSSSGDGVWLYGNINGWDSGNKSGVAYVSSETIGVFFEESSTSEYFRFHYLGVPTRLGEICRFQPSCRLPWADQNNCCFCASPKDWSDASFSTDEETGCGGSMRFGGNGYLVTLYTDYTEEITDAGGNTTEVAKYYCQSFKKDTPNLSTGGSFLPPGRAELARIIIIPTH